MAKKNYKKSRRYKKMRRRKIIFGMEIAVLLILSGILFVYAWINRSMDKMNQDTLDTSCDLNPLEGEYASYGVASQRYKYQKLYDTSMSMEEFNTAYAAWEEARTKAVAE